MSSINKSIIPALGTLLSKVGGVVGDFLYGWAYIEENLHERLVLEVFANNQSLGTTTANVFESSLVEKVGDACYGFVFKLHVDLVNSENCKDAVITIKIANTDHWLPSTSLRAASMSKKKSNKETKLFSHVYSSQGLRLAGWVRKPSDPNTAVKVSIYCKNELLRTVMADKFSPNSYVMDKGSGFHGFDVTLPLELADGKKHTIHLYDEEGMELNNSPITIAEYPQGINRLLEYAKTNNTAHELLTNIINQQQVISPLSIGLEHYAKWYELFGKLEKKETIKGIKFGFAIMGQGDINTTLSSIQAQSNPNWEIVSPDRIIDFISACRSSNINYYLALIEAGDHLPNNTLSHLANVIAKKNESIEGGVGIVYTDSDQDDEKGNRSNPSFKPDWNYEYFTEFNYIGSLCCVRYDLIQVDAITSSDAFIYHAVGNCLKREQSIEHYPRVCYHRKHMDPQTAKSNTDEQTTQKIQSQLLQQFLNNIEAGAIVKPQPSYPRIFRVIRPLKETPLVSLIIPTKDKADLLDTCLNSIIEKTTYSNIEIIVVNNQSVEKKTEACFEKFSAKGVRVIDYNKGFNYSAINNYAVEQAKGEIIGLVNNDVEIITPDWLEEMLGLLLRLEIGAVGAKLLWPNEMVQHGGVILGPGGLAGHFGNYLHNEDAGYMNRNQVSQELSAVTAACLLVRKKDYLAVGGLNEFDFPVAFNDVDFCLKLREKGLKNVWSAHAKLWHCESASRGRDDNPAKASRAYREQQNLKRRWGNVLNTDSCYNSNLNLDVFSAPFSGLRIT